MGKYKCKDYGLTFTEKWNTDNTLGTEVTIEDQLAKGLKLTFDTQFAPQTGKKSGKVKSGYKREHINANCDVDFDFAGPTVHGAAVLGYQGWLAGYQMSLTSGSNASQLALAAKYTPDKDTVIRAKINNATQIGLSYQQKVRDGVTLTLSSMIEGKNFNQGGHKVGLGLELEG